MIKAIFLVFFPSAFLIMVGTARADTNMVRLPDTLHNNTHILNNSPKEGTPSYAYDGDFSTGFGSDNTRSDGGFELYVISEHIFPKEVSLNKVSYRLLADCTANGKYTRTHNFYMYVEYNVDGTWRELPGSRHEGGGGEGDSGYDTGQVDYTSQINNVRGLRATVHSYSLATGGEGRAHAHGWIYEFQAWGSIDIGLRVYDGTSVVKIACEPAGVLTSPLRIHKNGTTYAIVLVDPSDSRASKIRIKTNSGIKALAKN